MIKIPTQICLFLTLSFAFLLGYAEPQLKQNEISFTESELREHLYLVHYGNFIPEDGILKPRFLGEKAPREQACEVEYLNPKPCDRISFYFSLNKLYGGANYYLPSYVFIVPFKKGKGADVDLVSKIIAISIPEVVTASFLLPKNSIILAREGAVVPAFYTENGYNLIRFSADEDLVAKAEGILAEHGAWNVEIGEKNVLRGQFFINPAPAKVNNVTIWDEHEFFKPLFGNRSFSMFREASTIGAKIQDAGWGGWMESGFITRRYMDVPTAPWHHPAFRPIARHDYRHFMDWMQVYEFSSEDRAYFSEILRHELVRTEIDSVLAMHYPASSITDFWDKNPIDGPVMKSLIEALEKLQPENDMLFTQRQDLTLKTVAPHMQARQPEAGNVQSLQLAFLWHLKLFHMKACYMKSLLTDLDRYLAEDAAAPEELKRFRKTLPSYWALLCWMASEAYRDEIPKEVQQGWVDALDPQFTLDQLDESMRSAYSIHYSSKGEEKIFLVECLAKALRELKSLKCPKEANDGKEDL